MYYNATDVTGTGTHTKLHMGKASETSIHQYQDSVNSDDDGVAVQVSIKHLDIKEKPSGEWLGKLSAGKSSMVTDHDNNNKKDNQNYRPSRNLGNKRCT